MNIESSHRFFVIALLFMTTVLTSQSIEIKGIYGHPAPLWQKGVQLDELGINAVFVHSGSIDSQLVNRIHREGLKLFAEFATLNGKTYVDDHPEARAIDQDGLPVEAASWFMGVCPTEPGFRSYRFSQLKTLLKAYDLDGVWLDYVHWHAQFEDPEPILPETCFCNHCLSEFQSTTGIQLTFPSTREKAEWILTHHDDAWRRWRCEVIVQWVDSARSIIDDIRPNALLGLYHCPWTDQEFDGARRRILGLDYELLKGKVDVFSPMVYHGRMHRPTEWVKSNIEWLSDRLQIKRNQFPKIWPIVQAHNSPGIISASQFQEVLLGGLAAQSSGVMMFTTRAIAEDEEKLDVVRSIYAAH